MALGMLNPTDRAQKWGLALGAAVGILPALFFGIVVGASFGGAYGAWIAERVSFGNALLVPFGLLLGFAFVFGPILLASAVFGRLLAAVVSRLAAV